MAALFCALVAAQKSRRSLLKFLRILPVSPKSKSVRRWKVIEAYLNKETETVYNHE